MAIEIVNFPIFSMVDLSIVFNVCLPGRVTPFEQRQKTIRCHQTWPEKPPIVRGGIFSARHLASGKHNYGKIHHAING